MLDKNAKSKEKDAREDKTRGTEQRKNEKTTHKQNPERTRR